MRLATNDPVAPVVYLTLHGRVPHDVDIWPDKLSFIVDRGEGKQRTLRLTGPETMDVTGAMSEQALVTVNMAPAEAPREGMNAWELALSVSDSLPIGRHEDTLRILTTHPERPLVSVPIAIEVRSALVIVPNSAFFGFVTVGTEKTVTLKVRSRDGSAFRIASAEANHPALSSEARPAGEGQWAVELTCKPAEPSIIDIALTLTTDIPGEERLSIPVYADAQAAH